MQFSLADERQMNGTCDSMKFSHLT